MGNNAVEDLKSVLSGKKAVIAGALALIFSVAVVFYLWNQSPGYQVLYSGLSPTDSGPVIEKLREKKIPYRVDGVAIKVPAEDVYEIRMELAGEGLPQGGGVGFEIFDKTGFGVSDFVQKVNYRRALQGELARTIAQIREVEHARVHLAIPEKRIFLDDENKSRASIVLELRPGAKLTQTQVSSIVHLVSGSFENLTPQDVTVVDTEGRMWNKGGEDQSVLALSSSQLEYKREIERDLEKRIETMIEKIVGSGKVVARVSVEVDTKHIERTEETFDPESQVVRSEQRNIQGVNGGIAKRSRAQRQLQDETINYEISKVVSRVVEPVGSIKRLTVAVIVDGNYTAATTGDSAHTPQYMPRSDKELADFTSMVKGAVGFKSERGDVITITSAPFEDEIPVADTEEVHTFLIPSHLLPSMMKYTTASFVALLVLFLVIRPLMKMVITERSSLDRSGRGFAGPPAEPEHVPETGPTQTKDASIFQLKQFARENPRQVAMVLKRWIREK